MTDDPRKLLDAYGSEYLDPEGDCAHDHDDDRADSAPKAFAALRAVLIRHEVSRHGDGMCCNCFDALGNHLRWPCPTVQAITRALNE